MMNACKNTCKKYSTHHRYLGGAKRCRSCNLFVEWLGRNCPCCGVKLSMRRRVAKQDVHRY